MEIYFDVVRKELNALNISDEFMYLAFQNISTYGKQRLDHKKNGLISGNNIRDQQMAENFKWLLKEKYPNAKIIVWAHSGHSGIL